MDYLTFITYLLMIWVVSDLSDALCKNWREEIRFKFIAKICENCSDDFIQLLYHDLRGKKQPETEEKEECCECGEEEQEPNVSTASEASS